MTRRPVLAAVLAVALGGCLPSSQRQNDRSISAADSASAAFAATVPVDTLAVVWTASVPADDPMPVPSSLAWVGEALAVVETQEGSVRRFSGVGAYLDRTDLGGESFPYVAGTRGDTLVVLARGRDRLLWVIPGGGVVREVPVPAGASAALAAPGRLAARIGGGPDARPPEVVRLGEDGAVLGRHAIRGADWRAVGRLRSWGDTLIALSGYRPVVDVLPGVGGAALDTLVLEGFASPQLVRAAQFARGEVDEPPLLTSSAAALGDALFVLNLRADHVRVDVYGRDGRLRRVLVSPGPYRLETEVALDLAAREGADGSVELAVLLSRPPGLMREPASRVVLYRWRGER